MDPFSFVFATVAQIGISYLFPSEGPRLKDLKISASTYGAAIPWVFGLCRVPGNMVWSLPIREKKKKKAVGKGGSYNQYTYYCTFAMGLCAGPVTAIVRVWADGKIIYDARGGLTNDEIDVKAAVFSGGEGAGTQAVTGGKYRMRFYDGSEEQMPDAAIEADKGIGNTPAFRGLAYILFDDVPLEAFGNRIPQITAEVFVGGTKSQVVVTPYFEDDGVTPIDGSELDDEVLTDWERGYIYLQYTDELHRYSIHSGKIDNIIDGTSFDFPDTGGGDTKALEHMLCVGRDGSLYVTHGGPFPVSHQPIDKLDPYSYQSVAHFGSVSTGSDANTATSFGRAWEGAVASSSDGREYLLTIGFYGQLGMVKTSNMSYVMGADEYVGDTPIDDPTGHHYRLVGRDPDGSGKPVFYVLWENPNGNLDLLKVTNEGQTFAGYLPDPDGPSDTPRLHAHGLLWDTGAPGCIIFWSSDHQSWVSKWSEDTGEMLWTKEVLGIPARMHNQSRITTNTVAWVHDGMLYNLDTLTGEYVARRMDETSATGSTGAPDWQAYIALYPDIKTNGFDLASKGLKESLGITDLVSYAQWHWENYGKNENRTLPRIGDVTASGGGGAPDWDAYLALYPDVVDGYNAASEGLLESLGITSVQQYAEWHWLNYGQDEHRTLPRLGGGGGDGVPLPPEYAGMQGEVQAYDATRSTLYNFQGMEAAINVATTGGGNSIATIVRKVLLEGGLTDRQMDLTALYKIPLRGYGWARGTDIKSILDDLRRFYLFDMVERQGVLVAVTRGEGSREDGDVVGTIPQKALGSSGEESSDFWQETRTQEAELPAIVTLAYMNWDDDYETSTARSVRVTNPIPTMFSRQQVAIEMNLVLRPLEAKVQVNKILFAQWGERTKHETRLPWAYLDLDPGDLINVDFDDGRSYYERIHNMQIGADYAIETETIGQDSGAYDGWEQVVADGGGAGRPQAIAVAKVAVPFIINTPLLRDQDDGGGAYSRYYVGLGNGGGGTFNGAGLYISENNLEYNALYSNDNDVEWGTVRGVVPPAACGEFALDWKTRISIQPSVDWFEIEPVTIEDLWLGANACLIGNEVIQFKDCVENADGSWTIWNLLRGRRGTEYACGTHRMGERFVFLANSTIAVQGELLSAAGKDRYFKAVGAGKSMLEAAPARITYYPRDLMPYAPGDIRRTFAGSDMSITWARRTRVGGNMQDGTGEVALGEGVEKYEVYILATPFAGDLSAPSAPSAYLRMYETTTPSVTYTAAQQAEDGYSGAGDTLYVVVYQISAAVGRGFPGVRAIPHWQGF